MADLVFHCGICGGQTAPGQRGREVVLERRERTYPRRVRVHHVVITDPDKKPKRREVWVDDPGGVGWEIVRSVRACEACAVMHHQP